MTRYFRQYVSMEFSLHVFISYEMSTGNRIDLRESTNSLITAADVHSFSEGFHISDPQCQITNTSSLMHKICSKGFQHATKTLQRNEEHMLNALRLRGSCDRWLNALRLRGSCDGWLNVLRLRGSCDGWLNALSLRGTCDGWLNALRLRGSCDGWVNALRLRGLCDGWLNALRLRGSCEGWLNALRLTERFMRRMTKRTETENFMRRMTKRTETENFMRPMTKRTETERFMQRMTLLFYLQSNNPNLQFAGSGYTFWEGTFVKMVCLPWGQIIIKNMPIQIYWNFYHKRLTFSDTNSDIYSCFCSNQRL